MSEQAGRGWCAGSAAGAAAACAGGISCAAVAAAVASTRIIDPSEAAGSACYRGEACLSSVPGCGCVEIRCGVGDGIVAVVRITCRDAVRYGAAWR